MKAIIIGGGSIGTRHANNLQSLNIETRTVDVDEIQNIKTILVEGYDFGFVCSPNIYHVEHCMLLAEYGIPTFCEKPFYTDREGVDQLLELVSKKQLTNMVGCNLRFTPEVESIKEDTRYISAYLGYNLKKWRPGTDHLKSYSANKSLGGGILLDAIHELDYLYSKFGSIDKIYFSKHKLSDITIDTEDLVVGRIEFKSGTLADFNLNYLSEDYHRYYDILEGDTLRRINFNISNQMYVEEIKYFVDQVLSKNVCMNSFREADSLLKHLV